MRVGRDGKNTGGKTIFKSPNKIGYHHWRFMVMDWSLHRP